MASSELNRLLEQAIQLIQSGNPTEGRQLLQQVLAQDANFAAGWMWLASAATTRDERVMALRRVLQIDPNNTVARAALQQLGESPTLPEDPLAAAFAPRQPQQPFLSQQDWVMLGIAVVIMLVVVLVAALVSQSQNDEPTPIPATKTFTPSPSFTPSMTFTPRPTSTPIIQNTLPPTWTPEATLTPLPTRTPYPTWTPLPTRTSPFAPRATVQIWG
ncbi:MAG: hypothetical protein HY862_18755 [Chloroflexi bacterium]|nr:hypothetical protein [Chloroflexota bacterium]